MSTQTFVLESMKEMQKRGWDVTLICNMNQQLIDKIPEGMHYYNVPMERSFSLTAAIKSTWQLIKIFRKFKPQFYLGLNFLKFFINSMSRKL